jgi:hypothetical protein
VIWTISPIEMVDQIDEQTVPRSLEIEGSPTLPLPRIVEPSDLLELPKTVAKKKAEKNSATQFLQVMSLGPGEPSGTKRTEQREL